MIKICDSKEENENATLSNSGLMLLPYNLKGRLEVLEKGNVYWRKYKRIMKKSNKGNRKINAKENNK